MRYALYLKCPECGKRLDKETEKLIELGKAVEKAFQQDYPEFNFGIEDNGGNYNIESVYDLMDWYYKENK